MAAPVICGRCGEEVRLGYRHGPHSVVKAWWHREAVDHVAVLGTPADWSSLQRRTKDIDEVHEIEIPEPEVRATPVGPKDEHVPGGVRTITNLLAKTGWNLVSLTYARGPYLSAKGTVLSISDSILLKARVDDATRFVVASWRDGGYDFGYAIAGKAPRRVNATELKDFIREASCES